MENIYFDEDGEKITEEGLAYAKAIMRDDNTMAHFIPVIYGAAFDPFGPYKEKNKGKYTKCNQKAFDFYLTYLKTKERKYYTHANREFMNG